MLRWVPSIVVTLAGLYCVVWGIIASSSATRERGGAAFLGVMLLLLAVVQWRVNLPQPQGQKGRNAA
jgi:drug/metabolite transporter (DMT)-like permease